MVTKDRSNYRLLVMVGFLLSSLVLTACLTLQSVMSVPPKGLVRTLQGHTRTVSCVVFSPDGVTLASSSLDTTVRLWRVATGEVLTTLQGHPDQVNTVAFSPDGTLLASGNGTLLGSTGSIRHHWDGTPYMVAPGSETPLPFPNMVILWGTATGAERRRWQGFETGFWGVAFSPDGKLLAAGGGTPTGFIDDAVRLWDVATGEPIATFREHRSVWSIAFSPDGATLASGNGEGITLWDIATGKMNASLGNGAARSVVFSPDGALLASGYDSGKVRLWNMATHREETMLDEHNGIVYAVAFSPDGKTLASAGQDGTVHLWNVATRKAIATIRIPKTWMVGVAFSPDGKLLASGSSDGLIRLWDIAQVQGK